MTKRALLCLACVLALILSGCDLEQVRCRTHPAKGKWSGKVDISRILPGADTSMIPASNLNFYGDCSASFMMQKCTWEVIDGSIAKLECTDASGTMSVEFEVDGSSGTLDMGFGQRMLFSKN